jgi:hypothetical protein
LKEKRLSNLFRTLAIAALAVTICASVNAAAMYAPGLNTIDLEVTVPAGAFVSGFDVLPNGHYLINDGYAIREVSPTGSSSRYSFATPVWGTFVRYNPADGKVYFGDSTNGDIRAFSYADPGDVALVTNIPNNFDMDFRQGQPYVVGSADWTNSSVYVLQDTGAALIATCDGPSGPLAFDSEGNLVYIPASYGPTTEIIRWSSADVAEPRSTVAISRSDAEVLAAADAGYGSAFNSSAELMFTNNGVSPKAIQVYKDGAVSTFATFVQPGGLYPFVSLVRENPATGAICALVSYSDPNWNSHTVISQMAVPEPSSLVALCSLIGLAASAKLLRGRRK